MEGTGTEKNSSSPNDATYTQTAASRTCHRFQRRPRDWSWPVGSQSQGQRGQVKDGKDKALDKVIQRAKRFFFWNNFRVKALLPSKALFQPHPTLDQIVGMTLHCFMLSILVLAILFIRTSLACLRFACFLILHLTIYRGKVTPIWTAHYKDQVTGDELRAATIFRVSGLALVITAENHCRQPIIYRHEAQQRYGAPRVAFEDCSLRRSDSSLSSTSCHALENSDNTLLTNIFSRSSFGY